MTDRPADLNAIRWRLESSKPHKCLSAAELVKLQHALDDLHKHAPRDIAALLSLVDTQQKRIAELESENEDMGCRLSGEHIE